MAARVGVDRAAHLIALAIVAGIDVQAALVHIVAGLVADIALAVLLIARGDERNAPHGELDVPLPAAIVGGVDALGVFCRVLAGYLAAAVYEAGGVVLEICLEVKGVHIFRRDVDADQPVFLRRGSVLAQHGAAGQHQGEGEYECDREFLHVVPPI